MKFRTLCLFLAQSSVMASVAGQVENPIERRISDLRWQGLIKVVGSTISQHVVIDQEDEKSSLRLCPSPSTSKIGKLAGMLLEVEGTLLTKPNQRRSCIEVSKFQILKTTTGRKAAVGILVEDSGSYFLEGDAPKVPIKQILPGMDKLVGKRIIISLSDDGSLKDNVVQPTSYMAFPEKD